MAEEVVSKIESVSKSAAKKVVAPIEPDKAHFDALMQQGALKGVPQDPTTKATSYLEQLAKSNYNNMLAENVSTTDLAKKAQKSVEKIDTAKTELEKFAAENPNAEIPSQYRELMNKKLAHIDDNVKIALTQVGVEYTPPGQAKGSLATPIERFLGSLTNAQYQLSNFGSFLTDLGMKNQELSPIRMIAVQAKVNQIQQQLELFTNLMNKVLEGIKTTMNVQV